MAILEKIKKVATNKYVVYGTVIAATSAIAALAFFFGRKKGYDSGNIDGRCEMLDELEDAGILLTPEDIAEFEGTDDDD